MFNFKAYQKAFSQSANRDEDFFAYQYYSKQEIKEKKREEHRKNKAVVEELLVLKNPTKDNINVILNYKAVNKVIDKDREKTLLDFIFEEEPVNLPVVKLLLDMGASPKHRYLDFSEKHKVYINTAKQQGDKETVSFFAAHGLGNPDDYEEPSDKALWSMCQSFNEAVGEYGRYSQGWEKGHVPELVIQFLLMRKEEINNMDGLERLLQTLKEMIVQSTDINVVRECIKYCSELGNKIDIKIDEEELQDLYYSSIQSQLHGNNIKTRDKIYSWALSHPQALNPRFIKIVADDLEEGDYASQEFSQHEFIDIVDMLVFHKNWSNRSETYSKLISKFLNHQISLSEQNRNLVIDYALKNPQNLTSNDKNLFVENLVTRNEPVDNKQMEEILKFGNPTGEQLSVLMGKTIQSEDFAKIVLLFNLGAHILESDKNSLVQLLVNKKEGVSLEQVETILKFGHLTHDQLEALLKGAIASKNPDLLRRIVKTPGVEKIINAYDNSSLFQFALEISDQELIIGSLKAGTSLETISAALQKIEELKSRDSMSVSGCFQILKYPTRLNHFANHLPIIFLRAFP